MLSLKAVSPTRLIKNDFFQRVVELENKGASIEELRELQGKGRSKKGIFEGDLTEGMLEIGQCAVLTKQVETVRNVFEELLSGYRKALERL